MKALSNYLFRAIERAKDRGISESATRVCLMAITSHIAERGGDTSKRDEVIDMLMAEYFCEALDNLFSNE